MRHPTKALVSLLLPATLFAESDVTAAAASHSATASFTSRVFASRATVVHGTPKGKQTISNPDDITSLDSGIFVGFQNGIGPQGQASTTGNRDSTIVEFNLGGHAVAQWDVVGKCDGLTADAATGLLIATVNEDAHSSVYVIDPRAGVMPVHYRYNESLPSNGCTDAISFYKGMTLTSASAPGTTGLASASTHGRLQARLQREGPSRHGSPALLGRSHGDDRQHEQRNPLRGPAAGAHRPGLKRGRPGFRHPGSQVTSC